MRRSIPVGPRSSALRDFPTRRAWRFARMTAEGRKCAAFPHFGGRWPGGPDGGCRRSLPGRRSLRGQSPHPSCSAAHLPPKWGKDVFDHPPAGAAGREGKARGVRASPGALIVLPFRRDRPPRAVVFHALAAWLPCSGLAGSAARAIAGLDGGGTSASPAVPPSARGEQADVIHRRPTRTPGLSSTPASSLDHSPPSSRRWIRRLPHRRDAGIIAAADTSLRRGKLGGGCQWVGEKNPGIASRFTSPSPPRRWGGQTA
ncbi:hypothetical protein GGR12_002911 [Brevundimonas lenta]|uniref:Uncharacterized protein n=1 Tax=Brevundimonas lenta TaxID=424796 RepID=A0A7W6JF63_9CAUL|nr:hypothetical protein [Brevundimonas lenta]